ncbi:hypothetical protein CspHIS471_0600060 [Cutaneotrichosporon sp. HIS471]|nr:hypothetical protein CspHIS471_0600060 [Cutaneotrichosporon sp. HIS471]
MRKIFGILVALGTMAHALPASLNDTVWVPVSGQWAISGANVDGTGNALQIICPDCTSSKPLREARTTVAVKVPLTAAAGAVLDISLSSKANGDRIGVRLSELGSSQITAALFTSVGGVTTPVLGSGSSSTLRKVSGGTLRVELDWRGNNLYYRIYPDGSARPGAPLGGFSIASVNLFPNSVQVTATNVTTRFTLVETRNILAGYPTGSSGTGQGLYYSTPKNIVAVPTWDALSPSLPQPVVDSDPDLIKMYNGTWKILLSKNILQPRSTSPLVRAYVDAGFDPAIMCQWDTIFSLQYAIYAHAGFDAIASLDNWYILQLPTGEIRRAYESYTGKIWKDPPLGFWPLWC